MNCRNWEERIALYAGGDLAPEDAAEVERHLEDCPGCQVFASGLQASLDALEELRGEPIAEAHFAAVRARVIGELSRSQRGWWRKGWAFGFAAAAAVVLAIGLYPIPPAAPLPGVILPPPPVPILAIHEVPPVPRIVHRVHRPRPAKLETPVVVKLLTDDPEVVIYWITDNSGE